MGSTRYPGKSMVKIARKPLIWHIVHRLKKSSRLSRIYLATSVSPENDILAKYASGLGVEVFRGSEDNVFSRFESIIGSSGPSTITRVCGDCPLIDTSFIDRVLDIFEKKGVDIVKADRDRSIHQGINIFSVGLFNKLKPYREEQSVKEHVINFSNISLEDIKTGLIQLEKHEYDAELRLSIDTPSDLKFIQTLYKVCEAEAGDLSSKDIVKAIKKFPKILNINGHVYQKTAEQKTVKVFFIYNQELMKTMFCLAKDYIEKEGLGVRFLVKKEDNINIEFEKYGFGVVNYSDGEELKNIIKKNPSDFTISEQLPNITMSQMGLGIDSILGERLIKYSHDHISDT